MMPAVGTTMMKGALALGLLSLPGAALADTWVVSARDGSAVMKVDSCKVVETDSGFEWHAQIGESSVQLGYGYKCDGDNINGINDPGRPNVRDMEAIDRKAVLPGLFRPAPRPGPAPAPAPAPEPKSPRS